MKKSRFLILMFLGLFAAASVTFAEDARTKKGSTPLLDTNGNLAAPGSPINPKTGRAYTPEEIERGESEAKAERLRREREAVERARQEEERKRQEEAANPRCRDFIFYGSNARPEGANGGNYQCPAGYGCHWNGPVLECRALEITPGSGRFLDASTVVRQADTRLCSASFCGNATSPRNNQ